MKYLDAQTTRNYIELYLESEYHMTYRFHVIRVPAFYIACHFHTEGTIMNTHITLFKIVNMI